MKHSLFIKGNISTNYKFLRINLNSSQSIAYHPILIIKKDTFLCLSSKFTIISMYISKTIKYFWNQIISKYTKLYLNRSLHLNSKRWEPIHQVVGHINSFSPKSWDKYDWENIYHVLFKRIMFIYSAIPFYCCIFLTMQYLIMPSTL